MQSFTQKQITLTVQLGQGSFGGNGQFDTVTLSGLRVSALLATSINNSSIGIGTTQAIVNVFGLTLSQINQLTKAGGLWTTRQNLLTVQAGDNTKMPVVFNGGIIEAKPLFVEGDPNTPFVMTAFTGSVLAVQPATPTTYPGAADVAQIMGVLANRAGLGLENNLTTPIKMAGPYFSGTLTEQIAQCASAANIYYHIDGISKVLAIWPKSGSRAGNTVISPANGLIGYPRFQLSTVEVETLFNPNIFAGGTITIQNDKLTAANGRWRVMSCNHTIESMMPDGQWRSSITAAAMTVPPGNETFSDIQITPATS